jgi:uncharacterized protein (TIGR00730 family)
MERICVYCGARCGDEPAFALAARKLGQLLARHRITLVYGGGNVGLMGQLADALLAEQGQAIGVIPRFFVECGLMHTGVLDQRVTDSMHERKAMMANLSDAFIALPGGIGTFEELLEILTWGQLNLHRKPVAVLNVNGFFDPLLQLLNHLEKKQFLAAPHVDRLIVEANAECLMERLIARFGIH